MEHSHSILDNEHIQEQLGQLLQTALDKSNGITVDMQQLLASEQQLRADLTSEQLKRRDAESTITGLKQDAVSATEEFKRSETDLCSAKAALEANTLNSSISDQMLNDLNAAELAAAEWEDKHRLEVVRAQAELRQSQAELQRAQITVESNSELTRCKLVAAEDLAKSELIAVEDRHQLETAKARVELAKSQATVHRVQLAPKTSGERASNELSAAEAEVQELEEKLRTEVARIAELIKSHNNKLKHDLPPTTKTFVIVDYITK